MILLPHRGSLDEQEELMSVALSLMAKFRHRLLFALSPSYRRVRQRLDEIALD